ncbi:MAG: hypothetical protein JEZ04_18070 [Spirochaetales bacterium]|nr:hypothetical protein [Spirochaetales bacterium]
MKITKSDFIRRLFILSLILSCTLLFTACRSVSELASIPLNDYENMFIGNWKHVHGIGNVWNKSFTDDRSVYCTSTNLIWGDGSAHYLWEADAENLFFYETDTIFLKLEGSYLYFFNEDSTLVIDGNIYELQP